MILDEELNNDGTVKRAGQQYYMKPMNCPFHNLIYKSRGRSYREVKDEIFALIECGDIEVKIGDDGSPERPEMLRLAR